MALTIPFNVRDFFLNKGRTGVFYPETGSPRYTLSNISVYAIRLSDMNNPASVYVLGDRRVVFAKTDADAVGYTPRQEDLMEYNGSTYRVMDVNPGEQFDQYKLTVRRV